MSGALVVGGAVAGIHFYRSNVESPGEQAVNEVIDKLAKLPGAVRFGEIFRKLQNNNSVITANSIHDRLFKAHGALIRDSIDEALEQQIQIELRTNQVYLVDDWYLTRTEAELCSLASIKKES